MPKETRRILVTGAAGQIGSELTLALRKKHGPENVVASDIRADVGAGLKDSGPFELLDVLDAPAIAGVIKKQAIDTIYHMAALLSAVGEKKPQLAWDVNLNGTFRILEAARENKLVRVFCPSSIAVFGPETPRQNTPNDTILKPKTMYGLTKVAGELLGDYYVRRFGVDVRGCRYPGIISYETLPGGGTTDYAVAIFFEALQTGRYTCFLREETRLPMMYMPDCLKATMGLFLQAQASRRLQRDGHELQRGRAGRRNQEAHPGFQSDLCARFPPVHRRLLAGIDRRFRGAQGVGLAAGV
jgi:nucleoside-diphosphate-sugar epimerase